MVGENEHTYAINPLNWKTDSTPADRALNKGACFTDYSGNITSEISELTGAYIDEKRGTLKVTDISETDYPASLFDEGIYHIYDYQFFYRNLQDNVARRTTAFLNDSTAEIDIEAAPGTNPQTDAELPGLAVLAISTVTLAFSTRKNKR